MAKKKQSKVQEALNTINELRGKGFSPLFALPTVSTVSQSARGMSKDELSTGNFTTKAASIFMSPSDTRLSVPDEAGGTQGRQPVSWGVTNSLPSQVYRAFKSLPYTAAGQEYLANSAVGLGIDFRYKTIEVSDSGKITEVDLPYKHAGKYLKAKIRRAEAEERLSEDENSPLFPHADYSDGGNVGQQKKYSEELREEYAVWERTNAELQVFLANNNLAKLDNDVAQDDLALDIYFRAFGIELSTEQQRKDPNFKPKIVSVSSYPAVIARLEERDADGVSKYTYLSESWRYGRGKTRGVSPDVDYMVLPNVDVMNPHGSLKAQLKKDGKQTWFVMPYKHLSSEQCYYPVPACWSIFPSLTFLYASTLMFDKAAARQNSTMWGKIIYISDEYLEKVYSQTPDGHEPEVQKKVRDGLVESINNFLKEREHNGTTVALQSFIGPDGKTVHDSIRIVDVPSPTRSTTDDEIESMSSCINAALNLDSRLVGSVPGAQTSSSGTQARELELLETKKLATRKLQYKHFYKFIIDWNDWDTEHLEPVIREMTLTTLDASKTGLAEQSQ